MSARIIDGKAIAAEVTAKVKEAAEALEARTGQVPGLAVVLVGEDPASQVYVANKSRTAKQCGFKSVQLDLPADLSQEALLHHIARLNADPSIHGILVQLPLPKGLDAGAVTRTIDPDKDADGLHPINVGRLGMGAIAEAFLPCTPAGSMVLLRRALDDGSLAGKTCCRGRAVQPRGQADRAIAAQCRLHRDHGTFAHRRPAGTLPHGRYPGCGGRPARDDPRRLGQARRRGDRRRHQSHHDARGEEQARRRCGDGEAAEVASAITPVPGGVGPMTIAMLLANTLRSAYLHNDLPAPDLFG